MEIAKMIMFTTSLLTYIVTTHTIPLFRVVDLSFTYREELKLTLVNCGHHNVRYRRCYIWLNRQQSDVLGMYCNISAVIKLPAQL